MARWTVPSSAPPLVTKFEAVTLLAVAILIAVQLFVQPIVGMADNGDFAKVTARLCMQPPEDLLHYEARYWKFSVTEYRVGPQHCLTFWQWTSMSLIAWIAKQAHDTVGKESHFDIRALGAVCMALWLICTWAMLRLLRGAPVPVRIAAGALALVVLTDVLFVAYFHSFYGDLAAMIFLFGTVVLAWHAALRPASATVLTFAASATLLVWSKGPHALIAPWLIAFAIFSWWRGRAAAWLWSAAILVMATALSLAAVPPGYETGTTFNVIFTRLVKDSPDPVRVLAAFDLPPEAVKYSGEYVYTPTTPYKDEAWRARYAGSLTPQRLLLFYFKNPGTAIASLWRDLTDSANMRIFAYYRHPLTDQPNRPVRSLLRWSDLRSLLIRYVPFHVPLFYAAILIAGGWWAWRGTERWQRIGGALAVALAGASITEFAATSLFDSLETERHLFLFHVMTDALIVQAVLAATWMTSKKMRAPALRSSSSS
jgi:hypothetical protein